MGQPTKVYEPAMGIVARSRASSPSATRTRDDWLAASSIGAKCIVCHIQRPFVEHRAGRRHCAAVFAAHDRRGVLRAVQRGVIMRRLRRVPGMVLPEVWRSYSYLWLPTCWVRSDAGRGAIVAIGAAGHFSDGGATVAAGGCVAPASAVGCRARVYKAAIRATAGHMRRV